MFVLKTPSYSIGKFYSFSVANYGPDQKNFRFSDRHVFVALRGNCNIRQFITCTFCLHTTRVICVDVFLERGVYLLTLC